MEFVRRRLCPTALISINPRMWKPIVQTDAGVTLLGGGTCRAEDLALARQIAPCLVAADGGADRALALGVMPEAVIGDLDSLSAAGRAALPPERLHRVAEQESTDFGKCLDGVAAGFYLALGFTGLRLDHGLAVLNRLVQPPAPRCLVLGEADVIFACPPRLSLDLAPGSRLSLFPMGPARGRSEGLNWPIAGIDFAPGGVIGTSNRVTGPVRLEMAGPMLVLLERAALPAALAGLGITPPAAVDWSLLA